MRAIISLLERLLIVGGRSSDDEYRLLRQNLFERFASGSAVPVEAPLVPMSKPAGSSAEPRSTSPAPRSLDAPFIHLWEMKTPCRTSAVHLPISTFSRLPFVPLPCSPSVHSLLP